MQLNTGAPGSIADAFTILDYINHLGISPHLNEANDLGDTVEDKFFWHRKILTSEPLQGLSAFSRTHYNQRKRIHITNIERYGFAFVESSE